MPQPPAIVINNTHLLRAAMLFMVLGVIGPGLFQLKPPQWFGDSVVTDHPELAEPATAPSQDPALNAPAVVPPRIVDLADSSSSKVNVPASVTDSQDLATPNLDNVAPEIVIAPPRRNTPGQANPAPSAPEKPAVVARKTRQRPPSGGTEAPVVATAPPQTEMVSLAPRTAKLPAIPNPSSSPALVTRDFAKHIPDSHLALPVKRQKESFIAITLPLILAANEEISQRRSAIIRAASRGDQATMERWARLYRIETEGKPLADIQKQLLLRADFVPVSLALAQAAIESGWGTSRFARQGNALFGQWAWQKDAGLKPTRASNSNAVVRSFPNLFGSVRAYMHNLNTHPRYAAFRARRHLLRGRKQADLGYQLSNFLDGYAEIGEVYVSKLKSLIRSNEFGQYETAQLR